MLTECGRGSVVSRLLVLLDEGAVLVRDLLAGVQWCDAVMFAMRDSPAAGNAGMARFSPLFAEIGDVVSLDDLDEALDRARRFAPTGVLTFSEALLGLASRFARELECPFSPPEVVAQLQDKGAQRRALQLAGVDNVRTRYLSSPKDWARAWQQVGLPLVLKPVIGAGSRHTYLIEDVRAGAVTCREFFGQAGSTERLVAEEFLAGRGNGPLADYVSVETVVVAGRIRHLGVTGKLPLLAPFRETGQFFPSGLMPEEESSVTGLVTAAITALGLVEGAVHTEVKLTARGPRIIEVNGRLGGYTNELYSRVLDVDVVELVGRAACGEAVPERLTPHAGAHFQHCHQPLPSARAFVGVDGGPAVARHPAVTGYHRLVEQGDDAAWRLGVLRSGSGLRPNQRPHRNAQRLARIMRKVNFQFRH